MYKYAYIYIYHILHTKSQSTVCLGFGFSQLLILDLCCFQLAFPFPRTFQGFLFGIFLSIAHFPHFPYSLTIFPSWLAARTFPVAVRFVTELQENENVLSTSQLYPQIHRYTDIQIRRFTDRLIYRSTDLQIPYPPDLRAH